MFKSRKYGMPSYDPMDNNVEKAYQCSRYKILANCCFRKKGRKEIGYQLMI